MPMLRMSSLRLSTFARLLCGEDVASVMRSKAACDNAVSRFRKLSPHAPLPVPMAVAVTAEQLRRGALRDATAVVTSYHRPRELVSGLVNAVRRDPELYPGENLKNFAELLRSSSAPGEDDILVLLAEYSLANEATQPALKAEVRQLIQRRIRFHPSSAASLLRPLCLVSTSSKADREDVLEGMQIAMRGGFVDPADFGLVLNLLLQAKEHRRILGLWAWMRHTSACWDRGAASAALCAAAELRFMDDAVACIQCLAEAGHDPTVRAQQTFIRFLGVRSPPLPAYAEQLVSHWYPDVDGQRTAPSSSLWIGEPQRVGVELLFVHLRSQNTARVWEHLQDACRAWTGTSAAAKGEASWQAEAAAAFLQRGGVPVLMRRFAKDIAASPSMMAVFFDVPKRMASAGGGVLGNHPHLAGAFATIAVSAGREAELTGTMGNVAMDKAAFVEFLQFFADGAQHHGRSPQEVLGLLQDLAAAMKHEVPAEVSGWLQLLGEEGGGLEAVKSSTHT